MDTNKRNSIIKRCVILGSPTFLGVFGVKFSATWIATTTSVDW